MVSGSLASEQSLFVFKRNWLLSLYLMMDILLDILNEMVKAHPTSVFVNSLHQQYCNRGGLSKKQLEGLHSKAMKTAGISQGKLATLEAIIKKKPTRERAAATISAPLPEKDETIAKKYLPYWKNIPSIKDCFFSDRNLITMKISLPWKWQR